MSRVVETDLYPPIKRFLEEQGYEVKGEVGPADVVGMREGEEPVIVELKTSFTLTLLHQAVARQAITDRVYVAVPRWKGRAAWRTFKRNLGLCRRLGLGVLTVRLDRDEVQTHCDPGPFKPRKSKVRRKALLKEHRTRRGDPNAGGTPRGGKVGGGVVTAYKQHAVLCARYLESEGPSRGRDVAKATGVETATRIMAANHYGWFVRVERGVYGLTELGLDARE
ncbi:MAG: DUF2161 family putative PD-(D/E)XK-type phosphodiesterase [Acidobacteriota bacterium]